MVYDVPAWRIKKCKNCGTVFTMDDPDTWAYKDIPVKGTKKYFCRWSCLCAWRKKREEKNSVDNMLYALYPLRKYFKLSQPDVARWLGISTNTYSAYDRCDMPMPERHIKRLAQGFGCTPDDLRRKTLDADAAAHWKCIIPGAKYREANSDKDCVVEVELCNLANNLRKLRAGKGMTQGQVAKAAGIGKSTYQAYESAVREPLRSRLTAVAAVFGCTVDELCGLEERNEISDNIPCENADARG